MQWGEGFHRENSVKLKRVGKKVVGLARAALAFKWTRVMLSEWWGYSAWTHDEKECPRMIGKPDGESADADFAASGLADFFFFFFFFYLGRYIGR